MLLQLASSCERPRSPRHARSCTGTRGRGGSVKIKSQGWIINRTFRGLFSAVSTQASKQARSSSPSRRRQISQVIIRWKALDEIYKIYMLLQRSDLNILEFFRQTFPHFSANFCKFLNLLIFEIFSLNFAQNLMKICRSFANI